MDSRRFFCPLPLAAGGIVRLPDSAARHAARVLRLGPDDAITLFDGHGGEYAARIVSVRKEQVDVETDVDRGDLGRGDLGRDGEAPRR